MIQTVKYKCCGETFAACNEPNCHLNEDWLTAIELYKFNGHIVEMSEASNVKFGECKCKKIGISVIIRNQYEFEKIKTFLGEYLFMSFVPQMETTLTAIVIVADEESDFSSGSVGSAEYQQECGLRLVEFNEFFK
jgi:hypothetical protein